MIIQLKAECLHHELSWLRNKCIFCRKSMEEIAEFHCKRKDKLESYTTRYGYIVLVREKNDNSNEK